MCDVSKRRASSKERRRQGSPLPHRSSSLKNSVYLCQEILQLLVPHWTLLYSIFIKTLGPTLNPSLHNFYISLQDHFLYAEITRKLWSNTFVIHIAIFLFNYHLNNKIRFTIVLATCHKITWLSLNDIL